MAFKLGGEYTQVASRIFKHWIFTTTGKPIPSPNIVPGLRRQGLPTFSDTSNRGAIPSSQLHAH